MAKTNKINIIKSNTNRTRRNQTIKPKIGGEVIDSGGYGCVFSPALICSGENTRPSNTISKLMTKKDATEEYEIIKFIQGKLQKIPNYQDYFLIYNSRTCVPKKLSETDLHNFEYCNALKRKNITKENINSKLQDIMVLNLPYGGLPVDEFIHTNDNYKNLYKTHNALVNLLKNGILPMNREHIYHSDIKFSNVLIDVNYKARLIDWGTCVEYNPLSSSQLPNNWMNKPLQFNVPFSGIIFTNIFYTKYNEYVNNNDKNNIHDLKMFVLNYIALWNKKSNGHYEFINDMMYLIYNNQFKNILEKDKQRIVGETITIPYIVNYITDVLIHSTQINQDGTINLKEYINNVYINIIDIWGFIMTYIPMLEIFSDNNKNHTAIMEQLRNIFYEYLFKPRHEPIDMKQLFNDLDKLGSLIKDLMNQTNPSQIMGIPNKDNSKDKKPDENKYIGIGPKQLNILINTSIPGSRYITYKPSMTIKNTNNNTVIFNPFQKISQSAIDGILKENRPTYFTNKALFDTLFGMKQVDTLLKATRYGYIDNNIKMTLDALFPIGSVIYLNEKPFVIGDIQWTTGDWKINSRNREQLTKIPKQLLYGPNYPMPIPNTSKIGQSGGVSGNVDISNNVINIKLKLDASNNVVVEDKNKQNKPKNKDIDDMSYDINVIMELHEGTTLTPQQLQESKCNGKYNAIKKAFSDFIGMSYKKEVNASGGGKTQKNKHK